MSSVLAAPPVSQPTQIHPTAFVDPSSRLGQGVIVEAYVHVGPNCDIGPATRLRTRSVIVEHTTMGAGNDVHPYAVLGGDPQDRSFDPARRGELIIGDRNTFREGVTLSRGNWNGPPTRIGSNCYVMSQAHVGHNASVGDNVVMANGASLAGHARVAANVTLSAFSCVHQFTDVGEGVMFRGGAMVSMHVPPYVVLAGENFVAGLNAVGLKRNQQITATDRDEIKRVFRAVYRDRGGTPLREVLEALRAHPWGAPAQRFLAFIDTALAMEKPRSRGICGGRKHRIRARTLISTLSDTTPVDG
ncbi:MAG: acyl-ACP--UDP-N-acetylglucosamine O-acyltransferase [Planctomycetota bacterium]|nr:acyl-ACP--UDP-N-acetylglucosamine O-acyltransferase [Planctomycetota bacterium]